MQWTVVVAPTELWVAAASARVQSGPTKEDHQLQEAAAWRRSMFFCWPKANLYGKKVGKALCSEECYICRNSLILIFGRDLSLRSKPNCARGMKCQEQAF